MTERQDIFEHVPNHARTLKIVSGIWSQEDLEIVSSVRNRTWQIIRIAHPPSRSAGFSSDECLSEEKMRNECRRDSHYPRAIKRSRVLVDVEYLLLVERC